MPDEPAEPLSEWVDAPAAPPARPASKDPGRYVCRWSPLSLVVVVSSLALIGIGYLSAQDSGVYGIAAYMLVNATIGVMLTLAATAWGAMISLTESAKCGSLFVIFPPYMFYYAATRWRWMSQPSILFLCGIGLALGSILAGRNLLDQLAN